MSLKILLTGGSGMIGTKILSKFIERNTEINYTFLKNSTPFENGHHLDISCRKDTLELLNKINPDIVIHSAALANVDLCETNHKLADLINVKGTENIVEGCKIIKSKVVYISTSYVFDGKKDQYYEDDDPSPTIYYGITKYRAEEIVKNSNLDYLILRTDQPYCWVEKWQRINSVIRVIQTLGSSKILKEITDWYNKPTYVPNLVEALIKLLKFKQSGIFHLVGSDFINRYIWALSVAEFFGLNKNLIVPINSKELNLSAKRRKINLNNEKIFRKTSFKMIGIKEGIKKMYDDKNKNLV